MNDERKAPTDKLLDAYHRMMERVEATIRDAEEKTLPTLEDNLAAAKEKAVELGELTREEADRIATYLKRDMEDAAHYLAETGKELAPWLKFDIEQIESRLFEMMLTVADKTRLELDRFEKQMQSGRIYHTGEITGAGVLRCVACGEELHFKAPGHIPPCPKCNNTEFQRVTA